MESRLGRTAEFLLVEDNEDDVFLTRRGLERAELPVNLHHVENGEECIAFLRKQGEYANAPTPDLILLDLNLPAMDGREVLTEIVADDSLKAIPVVILSTSESDSDVMSIYKLRCSSYVIKPVDFGEFQRVIETLTSYWLNVAVLPE